MLDSLSGIRREDSDDELGTEDHPWEWIYAAEAAEPSNRYGGSRKRKRPRNQQVVGARMGDFQCMLGDIVLLKGEVSHEAWVGIICEFLVDEGEKAASFLWFSGENEIRNKQKKRTDSLPNELYITPSSDINSLTTINGKAYVMSAAAFSSKYPNGKVPRKSKEFGKVFICRRGCNTRTTTYTDEFTWEDVYQGKQDLESLLELIQRCTKGSRGRCRAEKEPLDEEFAEQPAVEEAEDVTRTPKRVRSNDAGTRRSGKTATPSQRKILVKKHLEFTPLGTRLLSPTHLQSSPYQQARLQLHVAAVPTSLPCREAEFGLVYSHLEAAIADGSGACIYISGTPGTGKTATVREVVSQLDAAVRADELDDFIFVEINGMKITDPHQAYSLLWEALKGQRVSPTQALDLLERELSHPSPRRVPCVVLMDELDQLVTKNQGVMYNFFNWPGLRHSRLIVLAVANTMDLPERTLSNKISSRLGLTRITFPGYNHEQLMRIVQSRLEGVPGNIVEPDAVQFASRKVAAVSGDARRALDICRRAVELAEMDAMVTSDPPTPSKTAKRGGEGPARKKSQSGRVTIETIRRAIIEATTSPVQQYLRTLPFVSRLLLTTMVVRGQRTGLAESTFGDVLDEMQRFRRTAGQKRHVSLLEQRPGFEESDVRNPSSKKEATTTRLVGLSAAAVDLAGAGIINLEAFRPERPNKIKLAVGDEEVRLALRGDPEIKAVGLDL